LVFQIVDHESTLKRKLNLSEYQERRTSSNSSKASTKNGNDASSKHQKTQHYEQKSSCEICNVIVSSVDLVEHQLNHFSKELVEHAKKLEVRNNPSDRLAGSARCGVCSKASNLARIEDQWVEIGRHIGRDHGFVQDLISKFKQNGCRNSSSETLVRQSGMVDSRSNSTEIEQGSSKVRASSRRSSVTSEVSLLKKRRSNSITQNSTKKAKPDDSTTEKVRNYYFHLIPF